MQQKQKKYSAFLATIFAGICVVPGCEKSGECENYEPRLVPKISSTELTGTDVVPELDTPLTSSGNAVWCATFQIAWNRACDDMIGHQLQIADAKTVASRLNGSPVTEAALPLGSYYAVAGRIEDGITETIHREMSRQFPRVESPEFGEAVGFVTYAYLSTKATFTTPFADSKQPIQFVDAAGVAHGAC